MHSLLGYRFIKNIKESVMQASLIFVSISCIFPLLWAFSSSLKTQDTIFKDYSLIPSAFHWENYLFVWIKAGFAVYFINTVFYTITVVLGIVIISSMAAFAFSKLQFYGKNALYLIFLSTMMIPVPAYFVTLFFLINKMHWINTRAGYIFPQINAGLALAIFLLKTFFDKTPPELEDSARIDGCSKFGVYRYIGLPLAKPAIAVVVIFNTLTVWNEFFWANLVLNDSKLMPLQRGLMEFYGPHFTNYPLLMAAIIITVVPVILVYLLMQKHIIKGIAAGAVKG
jgi:multiple sugar transport system permease protein/raffinose/stachyose/melibiose transport system permease protein